MDTFGNCQRPVFPLGVSKHAWKFGHNWSSKLQQNNIKEKHPWVLSDVEKGALYLKSNALQESFNIFSWEITPFLKKHVTSEEAIFHNCVYYQQISITRYQV